MSNVRERGCFLSVGALIAFCLLVSSAHSQQPATNRDFIVDGLTLGGTVYPDSATYAAYSCRPSEDFSGFTWCAYHHPQVGKFGPYVSWVTILHSAANKIAFITETITPAFFAPGDADNEIKRLSQGFGLTARMFTAESRSDLPHAILAAWGDVTLTPLDEAAMGALRRSEQIHRGLVADLIGDARRSARIGLPVYRLGGGRGFLWGADFNDAGKGSLRITTVDANALGAAHAPPPATVAPLAEAPSAPLPPPSPVVSPYAPKLAIKNNSCLSITDVTIDGARQTNGIGPGDTGYFHMDGRCVHVVKGTSSEATGWTTNIQCQGIPYENFAMTWIATNHPPVTDDLAVESLIVEKNSGEYNGNITITSKLDCVTLEGITANRGNCNTNASFPIALKFGQTTTAYYTCSKLLELNVRTDQGNATYRWNE